MNLALWLERTAAIHARRPALYSGDRLVANYGDFHRSAMGLAGDLAGKGINPGDRVALFMGNCVEYLTCLYGIWAAGAVVVPINAKLHSKEAAFILENSGAKMVFATTELVSGLHEVSDLPVIDVKNAAFSTMCGPSLMQICPRGPDDLAWLFYTSGTTGQPKGVKISHGMLMATSLSFLLDGDQVQAEDAAYYMAPMSHGAGLYAPLHVAKAARHICPASGGFDEVELLDMAEKHGPLSMFMAPTMVRRFTDIAKAAGRRGAGIKTIIYAGGPMYVTDIIDAVDWFGPIFVQIYGQGECPMAITALSRSDIVDRDHPRWRERLASVGRAQSVVEVAIGGENGFLAQGEIGEIMVRGQPVMPGYWQNDAATEKTLVDGWLLTGDMGYLDKDGYLTLRDRSKDMIITGGSNVYPREVEEVLLLHPDVHEVSVVGRKSAEWGEDIVAFVVLHPGASLDENALNVLCLAQIARFKRPKAYFTLPNLPKNNYGKVLKRDLRARLTALESS